MEIHFDTQPLDQAVYEQGGPLENTITATGAGTGYANGHKGASHTMPNSGNNGVSGFAKDFHARHFKKNKESSDSSA